MEVVEARRLKALEDENRQLKRLVADQALNLQILKDVLGKVSMTRYRERSDEDTVTSALASESLMSLPLLFSDWMSTAILSRSQCCQKPAPRP